MTKSSRLAHTPLSVLDLAPIKEGRTITQTFQETLDLAQHAEAWGDDHEVSLALNLPDVVGDPERVQHDPVLGPGARRQRRETGQI